MITPYYCDEWTKIYCGDCEDVIPQLDIKPDLILTDPPYVISTSGGGIGGQRKYLSDIKGFTDDGFNLDVLNYCDNWMCFCSKDQLIDLLVKASKQRWMLVTWNKPNPTPLTKGNYLPDTEYIVHSFASGHCYGGYSDKARYIVYPAQQNNLHPNEKPLPVMMKLVRVGSRDGDLILDPFMGSGTTAVAAKSLGRKCVCIEREERYCEIASKRLAQEYLPLNADGKEDSRTMMQEDFPNMSD
jgi:site-specific DNA-methyltransferase (adenine-specific)